MKRRHICGNPRQSRKRRSGQTLVETALLLTAVLLPLTLGMVQYGIYLNTLQSLAHISREAGRYAAIKGTESTYLTSIRAYTRQIAAGTTIRPADLPDANITVDMADGNARASGNAIRVTIRYDMSKKVFLGNATNWLPGLQSMRTTRSVVAIYVLE